MTATEVGRLWTVGAIAHRAGVGVHRVEYVIERIGVRPMGRAGIARVFDEQAVTIIEGEIERIDGQRKGVA
jgi:hypothetical protein